MILRYNEKLLFNLEGIQNLFLLKKQKILKIK